MRAAISDAYDAIVDLEPRDEIPTHAYAIVKQVYRIVEGRAVLAEAEPLRHDIREETVAKEFPVGSELSTRKRATDVVVEGSAFPLRRAQRMELRCDVGHSSKRIAVFGRRSIEWTAAGRAFIGPADDLTPVPVTNAMAYGGADTRVPFEAPATLEDVLAFTATYEGIYPRNPLGKGYYVTPDRFDGIELPSLEDPEDLLTDERLVVQDPKRWYLQPLPWSFDWMHTLMFPRLAYLGQEPRLPPESAELAEVRRGYVHPSYRGPRDSAVMARFYQEASLGMSFPPIAEGTPIAVAGMHPERDLIETAIPPAPSIEFDIEGAREPSKPVLTTIVMRPAEQRFSVVYYARAELPRAFIPGVHRSIPVAIRIGGGDRVAYVPPPTVRDRLASEAAKGRR